MKHFYYLCFAMFFLMPTKGICFSLNDNSTTSNQVQRVRIDVTTSTGFQRHLLLAFTSNNAASDGYDYGYDAVNSDNYANDSSWMVGEQRCVIQGVGEFHSSKAYPLGLFLTNAGNVKFELTGLEHFDEAIEVYIYDSQNGVTTSITNSNLIKAMPEGDSTNRFYITFTNNINAMVFSDNTLSTQGTNELSTPQIRYISSTKDLKINVAQGLSVQEIYLYNILGQKVKQWSNLTTSSANNYSVSLANISKGTYLVSLKTKTGKFNKRLIISK
ncbi:T9SS type A sorting domain-containing protein [Psychroserpens damuponensis]|uniref:T9SS type A sorting domain-containing protein n=1 Tax=Psychroserpens damuponensis TaxID=943936 RepID=UPI000A03C7B8|nr:T9SS type A sorting domain-containing protein [Psychroserpens damuponensis]